MTFPSINNSIPKTVVAPQVKKKHVTDNFETKMKNSADMNDCVAIPRTIFKGYLGVMSGSALSMGAGVMKPSKTKTGLMFTAAALLTYGAWAFARPYVLKDNVQTIKPNPKN